MVCPKMDGSSTVVAGPLQFWRVQSRWDHFDGRDTQLADHEISELLWAFGLQRGSAPKNKADHCPVYVDLRRRLKRLKCADGVL